MSVRHHNACSLAQELMRIRAVLKRVVQERNIDTVGLERQALGCSYRHATIATRLG